MLLLLHHLQFTPIDLISGCLTNIPKSQIKPKSQAKRRLCRYLTPTRYDHPMNPRKSLLWAGCGPAGARVGAVCPARVLHLDPVQLRDYRGETQRRTRGHRRPHWPLCGIVRMLPLTGTWRKLGRWAEQIAALGRGSTGL